MKRVVVVCPGRGSYTRDRLGTLLPSPSVAAVDAFRAALGRPTPTELDAAAQYSSRLHVAGENASILTFAASLSDRDALRGVEVVAVTGNSMGWYSALAVAGALELGDACALVETFGQYQAGNVVGGQLVYPVVDERWEEDPEARGAVDAALASIPDLHVSIRLGGQVVLGGTSAALDAAQSALPPRRAGDRDAPFALPLHSAFHTPLLTETAHRAQADLAGLGWRAPTVPLVDGRGALFRPRLTDPAALRAYTLGAQVVEPYDFSASIRVALREYAPDALVLLGPGGNLGGACAQVMIREGWSGLRSKQDFLDRQATDPVVLSMARPEQRARVT